MALAALVALAALAPLSALIQFASNQFGRSGWPGPASHRWSQIGATLALSAATALLAFALRQDRYGVTAVWDVFIPGVIAYVASSIWSAWAWSWPGLPTLTRWWHIWTPAVPWLALFAMGIMASLHPVEVPPFVVLMLYSLISAAGLAPSAVATVWLRGRMTSPDGVASGPTDHGKNQAGVHIRARYGVPIVLVGLPFVTAPLLALGAGGAIVFMLAVMAHVVGADWLLIRKPPAELRDFALACLQLAIGAPSALFAIGMTFLIARAGDNSWRAFPFAVTPAVLIWPVLIVVLARGPAESSDV